MSARTALIVTVVNVLVAAGMIAAYALWMAPTRTPRLAVIDVAELYRLKEAQVTARLTKPDSSTEERADTLRQVGSFATELNRLVQALPRQCDCLVLVRGAVVGSPGDVLDLTSDLRRQLGL